MMAGEGQMRDGWQWMMGKGGGMVRQRTAISQVCWVVTGPWEALA